MAHTTIRVKTTTRQALRDLARADGSTMQEVLERAIAEYRRKRFLDQVNRDYAELRADGAAWAAEEAGRRTWDGTLLDGLPEEAEPRRRPTRPVRRRRA